MMTFLRDAVAFEIIDVLSGNTVGSFTTLSSAEDALSTILDQDQAQGQGFALVAFDETGQAVGTALADRPSAWHR